MNSSGFIAVGSVWFFIEATGLRPAFAALQPPGCDPRLRPAEPAVFFPLCGWSSWAGLETLGPRRFFTALSLSSGTFLSFSPFALWFLYRFSRCAFGIHTAIMSRRMLGATFISHHNPQTMKTNITLLLAILLASPFANANFSIDTTTSGTTSSVPFGTRGDRPGNFQDDDADGLVDESGAFNRFHTVGQTFLVTAGNPRLTSFSFTLFDNIPPGTLGVGVADAPTQFFAYVMDWDLGNLRATGSVLYQSALQTSFNDGQNHTFTFSPVGLDLAEGGDYVAFLTQNNFERNPGNNLNSTVVTRNSSTYAGGQLVTKTDGTLSFSGLTSESWSSTALSDAAFSASFSVPEPSSALLILTGATLCWRRRSLRTYDRNA